ncbi:hypothetical protein DSM3645_16070 [Blastopirellula marina DSM 3645]|uniref:Carboxypeptidase regulatory-like domain-containing protein n=2 Tax=Blastopirellula marina TaxID=124 RepID=A3ZZR0_9BACT|nr:hypothetical protein DSM3645_16070 [Blastopirellula marina DSM 3645]
MALPIIAATGCFGGGSGGPELAKVTGVVTVNGKPVESIQVLFEPQSEARASRGKTDSDGKFEVYYNLNQPGAVLGEHHVQFELKGEGSDQKLIPAKYAFGAKGIIAEVTQEGPNEFQFDLTGK